MANRERLPCCSVELQVFGCFHPTLTHESVASCAFVPPELAQDESLGISNEQRIAIAKRDSLVRSITRSLLGDLPQ